MPKAPQTLIYQIKSIAGGQAPFWGLGGDDQYTTALAIDPEEALGSRIISSGVIAPVRHVDFSGEYLSGAPMWITSAPTTTGVYVYDANGTIVTYNSTLGGEMGMGLLEGGEGQGMVAYNDYLYMANTTSIVRFGQLSATGPAFADYWITTLGMSSLTDTQYPSERDVTYPNHVMHIHNDGRVYVAEYDGANGRIHSFITDNDGTDGSARYIDLTLPPGQMPTAIESYGTDLAILCCAEGDYTGANPTPGDSALFLWDATPGNRFYRRIPIKEPLATAMQNKNGVLYVVAGKRGFGFKVFRYLGGYSFETLAEVNEGSPPPQGAIDISGNMLAWGGYNTYPTAAAGMFTYGHRSGRLPSDSLNHKARISDTSGATPTVSCLKFLQPSRNAVMGWRTATTYGLDKAGTTGDSYASIFKSQIFQVGAEFELRRVVMPLTAGVASGVTITPTIYVDDEAYSEALPIINTTNYADSERIIDVSDLAIHGYSNFYLQLAFTGTTEIGVALPITFEVESYG